MLLNLINNTCFRVKAKVILVLLLLTTGPVATESLASIVKKLDVNVCLQKDGSAYIEEQWAIDLDDDDAKTEWFVRHRGLGDMKIQGLEVDGFIPGRDGLQPFETLAHWNIEASRQEKTGKCGLNNGGEEICWGFGDYGLHQYTIKYLLTNLIKSYDTNDGFNHCFIDMDCKVENAKITIMSDDSIKLSEENTRRWAFGYEGRIEFDGNSIVAAPNGTLDSDKRMIIMLEFDKGVFQPATAANEPWADKKQRALDGSDYDDGELSFWEWVGVILFIGVCFILYYMAGWIITLLVGLGWVILGLIWWVVSLSPLRKWYRRKKLGIAKGRYYRDIKPSWTLAKNKMLIDDLSYFFGMSNERLIGALLLRLMSKGDIIIVREKYKDKEQDMLKIMNPLENIDQDAVGDERLSQHVLKMLTQASGNDLILQPHEFETWCKQKKNNTTISNFMKAQEAKYDKKYIAENAAYLYGLKAFLNDFSLLNERSVMEVKLWDEYLVYAEFFGIADQVRKQMAKICPEYIKISKLTQSLETAQEGDVVYMFSDSIYTAASSAIERAANRSKSSSGYSSFSSIGGGGGYSGGGGGGGR